MPICFSLPCAALALGLAAAGASAALTTATFDNFSEGDYGTSLQDPLSGIVVHDIVSVSGLTSIDDVGPTSTYQSASGNYLTTNGNVPGPAEAWANSLA